MKVDLHFHLEEGPYSLRWLSRTLQGLSATEPKPDRALGHHTLPFAEEMAQLLSRRMRQGCYSEEWLDRYLTTGRERGIQEFGVVDHLYRFRECRSYYEKHMLLDDSPVGKLQRTWLDQVCVASLADFVDFVTEAKKTRPELALGIEADFSPAARRSLARCWRSTNGITSSDRCISWMAGVLTIPRQKLDLTGEILYKLMRPIMNC